MGLEAGGCLQFSCTWDGIRGGMHAFWSVNQILGALVRGNFCVWICQGLLPCSGVLPEIENTESEQSDNTVKIPHEKVTFFVHSLCGFYKTRIGCLTWRFRALNP